jgi:hypothetical protein
MIVGSRMLYPEEVSFWDAELLQISVYNGMKGNLDLMQDCVLACKKACIGYVIHPVRYSLLKEEMFKDLREMAEWTDLALILHDERAPDGKRLAGEHEDRFRNALKELDSITTVSFENSTHTADVRWFWKNYADNSITLDIGHIESSGLNSLEFVASFDEHIIKKIQFIHMHRNNGLRGGITDHWPLSHNCREVKALEVLLKIKSDVSVILEINEIEEIDKSLDILRSLRDKLRT